MLSTTCLNTSNAPLMKKIINIVICGSATSLSHKPFSRSLSVSLFTPKLCLLFLYVNSSPCLVPSRAPSVPIGPWAAELCIFCEGADKQNHGFKQSLFRQCAVSGKSVRVTCTH